MNIERQQHFDAGIAALPKITLPEASGRNGEELATDEAAVWKRVLNFRLASFLSPTSVLETHPGLGISTAIYRHSCPKAVILDHNTYPHRGLSPQLIDIDPFGQPWDTIASYSDAIACSSTVMISNGEAQAVVRNWKRAQRYPSENYGKRMTSWVVHEYIPRKGIGASP